MQIAAIMLVMLPLLVGVTNGLFCQIISKRNAGIMAGISLATSSILACYVFYCTGINGNILHINLFQWFTLNGNPVNWSIYVDSLTSIMFIVVTSVSAVVHIYSLGYMREDENLPKFLSFLSFFTFFMLALVSADNFSTIIFRMGRSRVMFLFADWFLV